MDTIQGVRGAQVAPHCLIERVVLTPVPTGKGFEIEVVGEIAAMVALGTGLPHRTRVASGPGVLERLIKIVAEIRFGRQLSLRAVAC